MSRPTYVDNGDFLGEDAFDDIEVPSALAETPPAEATGGVFPAHVDESDLPADDRLPEASVIALHPEAPVTRAARGGDDEVVDGDDGEDEDTGDDNDDILGTAAARIADFRNNPHFRCLGFLEGNYYFLNLRLGAVVSLPAARMKKENLISLAPLDFWMKTARSVNGKTGAVGADWDRILDLIFRTSEQVGIWDERRVVGQGAVIDMGRIVFHTGSALWVEGIGTLDPGDFCDGQYFYTKRGEHPMPDMDNPFPADAPEVRQLLDIVRAVDWRKEDRSLSVMSLFGYMAISPICGVLQKRPHLWLDGAWGTGKSWLIQNVVNPVLGGYQETVKSNSTEPGLRVLLDSRSLPLVFDEAEGATAADRERLDKIISLARHTYTENDALVTQGTPGGGAVRRYAVRSMFLLASIATRLFSAADRTRFALATLDVNHDLAHFRENVERPAEILLRPENNFSRRLMARMILNAHHIRPTIDIMVETFMRFNLQLRVADVYAVYAAGAWLALHDGAPADHREAVDFINREFGSLASIIEVNNDLSTDRDHDRLFRALLDHDERIDMGGYAQTEPLGVLVRVACGYEVDSAVTQRDALRTLSRLGMRPARGGEPARADDLADSLLVHRNSPSLQRILENTPYATGYADVMKQAPDVVTVRQVVHFLTGKARALCVPLDYFGIDRGEREARAAAEKNPPRA